MHKDAASALAPAVASSILTSIFNAARVCVMKLLQSVHGSSWELAGHQKLRIKLTWRLLLPLLMC
jgi:hypothetical protein